MSEKRTTKKSVKTAKKVNKKGVKKVVSGRGGARPGAGRKKAAIPKQAVFIRVPIAVVNDLGEDVVKNVALGAISAASKAK
jgi:hypothetical protein